MELITAEKSQSFYNENLDDIVSLDDSPWKPLYKEAYDLIPKSKNSFRIIDLGCGAGRFAMFLKMHSIKDYIGIDFSSVRIKRAKEYVSNFDFLEMNLKSRECIDLFLNFDIFFLLEVLEHVRADISIIKSVPVDKIIILSVPSYAGNSHVRFFSSLEEVIGRYGQYITYQKAVILFLNGGKRFFILKGIRNAIR